MWYYVSRYANTIMVYDIKMKQHVGKWMAIYKYLLTFCVATVDCVSKIYYLGTKYFVIIHIMVVYLLLL